MHYAGNRDNAEQTAKAIVARGGSATAIGGDVGDEADVATLFNRTEQTYGGVDVVVNTAGLMNLAPLPEMAAADFDQMHQVNVRGTFLVSQQAVRRLRPSGALINVSTSVTRLQLPTYAAYAATKGAVEAMTLILAREVRGKDVTVNTVAPGPTATPLFLEGKPQEALDQIAQLSPIGRLGEADDTARVVAFLSGPDARWVNGQTIFVNGGAA